MAMEEHNREEPEETLIEIPTDLSLGNETFVTTSNESAASGTSLTELRRRLEECLDKKQIDLQCIMTWISQGCFTRFNCARRLLKPG
jgi:hypothetical protein